MKIGFIGLGNMGSGIARNLIKAGHQVTVYNRTRSRAEEAQVPAPMASLVHDRFVAALARGLGEADWAAVARISLVDAGLQKEVAR